MINMSEKAESFLASVASAHIGRGVRQEDLVLRLMIKRSETLT